jgi:Rps23 Pro-64 3,4-dihydroxylase Tpa1-like proline 4-hydroxylase
VLGLNPSDSGIIQQCVQWLNSTETLNTIKQITGENDIVAASAQATRYYPGHFLTLHNDLHETEQRRVAYVLNLTPDWHPDWGGLLQFYKQDGTPRDAWTPLFNSLVLFDVNHVHAVTYVAPCAFKPRLSITGWFRATPI